ncbi:MAG: BrnT family toxin [Azonexus sp.]|nr:BrnT family toxin [Azonexus sp.]
MALKIEWGAAKAALNLKDHGVSFDDATLVFYDYGRVETYDGREDYGEDRWVTVGFTGARLLSVAYTIRNEETIRLISARKADANEQRRYRQANT